MLEADIVEMRGLGEAEALVELYALCVISCYAGNQDPITVLPA